MTTLQTDADEYRLEQARQLLDLFKSRMGREAKTIEELETWVAKADLPKPLKLRP